MLGFELVIAAMILWRGRAVRLGLWAGAVFLIGITPLGVEELPNPILALGLAVLATRDFPKSALSEVHEALRRRLPGAGAPLPEARRAPDQAAITRAGASSAG